MQFSHISDMDTSEMLDYGVLYGEEVSQLKVKTFTHLQIRDFSSEDWISIFLDLLTCVLGVDNPLSLRSGTTTKGM